LEFMTNISAFFCEVYNLFSAKKRFSLSVALGNRRHFLRYFGSRRQET
jgi:hypothetical protein